MQINNESNKWTDYIYLCDGMELSTILLFDTTGDVVVTRNLIGTRSTQLTVLLIPFHI